MSEVKIVDYDDRRHLYSKFGFRQIPVSHSDYARCDIQMEMVL